MGAFFVYMGICTTLVIQAIYGAFKTAYCFFMLRRLVPGSASLLLMFACDVTPEWDHFMEILA